MDGTNKRYKENNQKNIRWMTPIKENNQKYISWMAPLKGIKKITNKNM